MTANSIRHSEFLALRTHGWYRRHVRKLGTEGLRLCVDILDAGEAMGKSEFETFVSLYFLDRPKPRNHNLIMELLMVANSRIR